MTKLSRVHEHVFDHAAEEPEIPKEPTRDNEEVTAQPIHHGGRLREGDLTIEADDLGRHVLIEGIGADELEDEEEDPLPSELVTEPVEFTDEL